MHTHITTIIIILLENRFQTSGRVEHMFIELYEEVELKLTALNYIMMPNVDSKCTEDPDKSISKVKAQHSQLCDPPCINMFTNHYL